MDPAIVRRLVDLNRDFYDAFAGEFSATRTRLHDGIVESFRRFDRVERLLDLGCGDARVGHAWRAGALDVPWPGSGYVGADNAASLRAARGSVPAGIELVDFDLTRDDFGRFAGAFDHVVSFSVFHHLPGAESRERVVRGMRDALRPGGRWAVSVWQIAGHPRFVDRIRPWSEAGIDPAEVEAGDLLVDWRQGGSGRRYVHHFEADEIAKLFDDNGLRVDSSWRSDGRSGDLGLYLLGRRA